MKMPFWPNPKGYRNIEFGLKRVFDLLERLDNPHLKLPPTIHIAGTNGKGSTLAFLQAILEESNLAVHKYTSPHLVSFNERIILSGQKIDDDFLNECLTLCKEKSEIEPKIPVTFFEGITIAAFLAFSQVDADILLLETGMGGRLDATNVLPEILCSIITPISFDHEEFLGDKIEKIATEKAGIIKRNCPVLVGRQQGEALEVIVKKAAEKNSKLVKIEDYNIEFEDVSLIGNHQKDNAKLAAICAKSLNQFNITTESIKNAVNKTFWPARLQKISSGKFYNKLTKNSELYLDGSHNIQGAKTITEFLSNKKTYKKILIFSMLNDRDCEKFLNEFKCEVDLLIAIEIDNETKSHKKEDIKNAAEKLGIKSMMASSLNDAFVQINKEERSLILVCGSLYLAGNFIEENEVVI